MLRVKELIKQLMEYDENSEVVIYDIDNEKTFEIKCVDADEGDESDEESQVTIII